MFPNLADKVFRVLFLQRMDAVHENYAKLQDALVDIRQHMVEIVRQREEDFLLVYKQHLTIIQGKFCQLEAERAERELIHANNAPLQQMQQERDWYRREALHLDKEFQKERKLCTEYKHTLEGVQSDRLWLSKELKKVMKERNELREELQKLSTNEDQNEGKKLTSENDIKSGDPRKKLTSEDDIKSGDPVKKQTSEDDTKCGDLTVREL